MLPPNVVLAILMAVPMSLFRRHRETGRSRATDLRTQPPTAHAPPRLVWSSGWTEIGGPSGKANRT